MSTSPLRPGDPRRLGDYRLVARLGEGGMGSVFLARSPAGRQVAVKVIRRDLPADDEFLLRFRGEVKKAQQVPPFCTAEVLDAATDHDPPYLVVEYVDGPSLAEIVREHGPLSGNQLHGLAIGVTTALAAIHDAGIVHRDLKPANVLLAPLSMPKVIDFGIAKGLETSDYQTEPGRFLGTLAYMGPERFQPLTAGHVGTAADIFAWGAVVTFAATGRTPFAQDTLIATAGGMPLPDPDLAELPPSLRGLVARALRADPLRRPTAHALLDELIRAGANGDAAIRASLNSQPGLRRAAAAIRHTVPMPIVRKRTLATLEQPGNVWLRWLPPKTVATIAAAALAAGFLAYPATDRLRGGTGSVPPAGTGAPVEGSRTATDDRASRTGRKGRCTPDGQLVATPQRPRAFVCPAGTATGDQIIHARFQLAGEHGCAAVWTDVAEDSYRSTVCTDLVGLYGETRLIDFRILERPLEPGTWHRIEIVRSGRGITVRLDERQLIGQARLTTQSNYGNVTFGAVAGPDHPAGRDVVTFTEVTVTTAP